MGQFIQYASTDGSAPTCTGAAGSIITLFNSCLITGYGSKSAPSPAWTHPVATAGNIASYQQGAGAGFGLVINDNGPNVTSTFKEAWATGWETVLGVGAPVGSGTGQFPTAAQLLTTGHTVIRKSASADGVTRPWFLFADSSSFYFFVASDTAGTYHSFFFGDFFSMKGASDAYRCMIIGGITENSSTTNDVDIQTGGVGNVVVGHFIARTYGGGGGSITAGKHGDSAKGLGSGSGLAGIVQTPNGPDASWYLSPIWVHENTVSAVRGRMRGLFQICHPIASFADGQTFSGAGDYAGKTFQIIKQGTNSGSAGMFCLETSATVETN